ncbi:MAG TPA: RICIN domain-containing protein [Actinophytocola sp.]|uniref:RICIN domain-containing protein n=1 Tax=Actinophytocola sp. TaxID=1872138 RepID=UPI002DDCF73A|nr:RICIN domain-containing protein [Actinophytocola sp.]HEV2781508.1 RICIN domain-containing protein [Actinophytocola sp.]
MFTTKRRRASRFRMYAIAAGITLAVVSAEAASASTGAADNATPSAPPATAATAVTPPTAPTPATAGYYRIINKASGKCLTPWGSGDGTAITQVTCDGGASQWWLLDPGSVGPISNYATGKCLDLFGNGSGDAQLVFTWTCYGANSQTWKPVNGGGQYYELHPYYTDKCLDLANGSGNDGAIIQQWGCHILNDNQNWWIG